MSMINALIKRLTEGYVLPAATETNVKDPKFTAVLIMYGEGCQTSQKYERNDFMSNNIPASEYSEHFDKLRKNRVEASFFKYGSAKRNFGEHMVNALETMELCIDKYKDTKNTEYLADAANYLMFEFMYPSLDGAFFKATDSSESAGISGFTIKDIEREVNENA